MKQVLKDNLGISLIWGFQGFWAHLNPLRFIGYAIKFWRIKSMRLPNINEILYCLLLILRVPENQDVALKVRGISQIRRLLTGVALFSVTSLLNVHNTVENIFDLSKSKIAFKNSDESNKIAVYHIVI